MRVLIIGGTGLISTGIVKSLLARGADITLFNRGKHAPAPAGVKTLQGDRNDPASLNLTLSDKDYDVVIDMVCFAPVQATAAINVFADHCRQYIFCSTVCTYGVGVPYGVLVDETFPQNPISGYGRDKLACERLFMEAHTAGKFATTIIRPSCTYGPGTSLIDNLEFDPVAWDRIGRGMPVLCGGDGLGLWVYTHRDDCGKAFAYAALNEKTFGQAYNATRDIQQTWREVYRQVATLLGRQAKLLFMPANWIVKHDPARFGLLKDITQFHGAYCSAKAKRDMPEFKCEIDLVTGAEEVFDDIIRRGKGRSASNDLVYEAMVEEAMKIGVEAVEV